VLRTLYCCLFQIQYCTPIARAIAAPLADIRWMKFATCAACFALPALRNQSLARPTPWMLVLDGLAVFGRQKYGESGIRGSQPPATQRAAGARFVSECARWLVQGGQGCRLGGLGTCPGQVGRAGGCCASANGVSDRVQECSSPTQETNQDDEPRDQSYVRAVACVAQRQGLLTFALKRPILVCSSLASHDI
jgi:hypothetical protein